MFGLSSHFLSSFSFFFFFGDSSSILVLAVSYSQSHGTSIPCRWSNLAGVHESYQLSIRVLCLGNHSMDIWITSFFFLFSRQNIIRISVLCILAVSRLVFFFFLSLRTFSISFLQVAFFSKLYIGLWFSTRMSTILKPLVLADTFYSVHNYESHASSMNYSTSEGRVIWYDDLDQFCSCSESIAYVLEWFFYLFNGFDSLY